MSNNTPTTAQLNRLRRLISVAMRAQDDFAIRFVYCDRRGRKTRRIVSPVRFLGHGENEQFSALCLCREEVRQFVLAKCSEVVLVHAAEILMPVTIEVLEDVES